MELLIIGIAMVLSGIVIYNRTKRLYETGEGTIAKVVGSEYHEEAKYYLFEFHNGDLITKRSSRGNSIGSYEIGDRVGMSLVLGYLYTQLNP